MLFLLPLGVCVAAFLSQKMHRSVTAKILLPDMFLRGDTKKTLVNCAIGRMSFFVRQDAKGDRAPRWRWIVHGFFK